ncbi:acyl-CoA dehydrogenase [Gordonia sp. X0973]|uniref:acyl-CoA dehydrogenase n=1 Tax=Gordonia sp. X0973 TaxID=2742602 RepID=UPI000F51F260|nr:acyl-CoA dehydrogenase [Gordonia sp. X0973]QKT06564.1 acyl-CoA dehydrogenase [Gordonia sp. X0973]
MAHLLSRRDLDFLLYEWLDITSLTTREKFGAHSRDTFDGILDLSQDLAAKLFAPHNKAGDQHPPYIGDDGKVVLIDEVKPALDAYAGADLIAAPFPAELDGLDLPMTISRASMAWFQAANPGTSSYALLTTANANLLVAHGSAEQIDTWVRPMLTGRYSGTMCLSEPQAGSSLADITTKARPVADGSYRITGTKMWISAGEHELTENIVHLVLAKAPGGGSGVKGISLFVVPKFLPDGTRNDVALVGLNHKMGNRGTTNTLLNFGDGTHRPDAAEPGAIGYLVGEEHKGLAYMFHMMNEARIGVGFLATAIGYAGYLAAVDYAKVRTQGRSATSGGEPVPIIEHADVKRMLLAQKAYVEGALALGLYCSRLVDVEATSDGDERDRAHTLLEVLTPIAKAWPSQWCTEANNLAIQVHGGYGYTTEFDVEQCYRDNRLNPIHEGTNGIQGLDLLGRKVTMNGGVGLALLHETVTATIDRAPADGEAAEFADALRVAVNDMVATTATLWSERNPAVALTNSSVYLQAAGHIVVAWMWLEQLLTVGDATGDFYDGKRAAARYFFRFELPSTGPQLALLASLDQTTAQTDPAWFTD